MVEPASRGLADWAAGEALRRDVALRVLAVVEVGTGDSPFGPVVPAATGWDERVEVALDLLADTETRLRDAHPDLKLERDALVGDPVRALEIAAHEASVLVVGSRGRAGFAGLALGSVSLRLAANARCPLVIVPKGHAATAHPGPTVVGVATHECLEVLRFGLEHTAHAQGELRVVHIWNPYPAHSATYVSDTDIVARKAAEKLADWLKAADAERFDLCTEISVLRGRPAEVLIEQSREADLLVVGSHRRWLPLSGAVGPTLTELLTRSKCPVAVVPVH